MATAVAIDAVVALVDASERLRERLYAWDPPEHMADELDQAVRFFRDATVDLEAASIRARLKGVSGGR